MKYIYKAIRITAWLLVVATGLTLLFGFLALKPFITHHINADISTYLHNILLPLVFMPLFFIHSLCGTVIAIQRQQWIKNKKAWQIGTSILWFGWLAVFGILYFIQSPVPPKQQTSPTQGGGTTTSPGSTNTTTALTLAEIKKHNVQSDCWMIISGKVYDLTPYFGYHPGGSGTMTPYCGTDGTTAFDTKDKANPKTHSSYASGLLDSYYIGDVGTQVDSQKIQGVQNQPTSNSGPSEEIEEDD